MTQHSKEPWRTRPLLQGGVQVIENGEPYAIAIVSQPSLDLGKGFVPIEGVDHVANARRVVACVNACTGVTTDALEKMPAPFGDLLSVEFAEVVSQRDKLLSVLEGLLEVGQIFTTAIEAKDPLTVDFEVWEIKALDVIAAVKRGAV